MVSVFGKADSTWNDDSERTFSRDPVHSSKRRLSISSHMKTMSMNTAQISPEPLKHPRRKLSDTVQTPPPKRRKLSEFEARWSEEDGDDDINHVVHRIDPSEDEQKATSASPQSIKHSSNHKQKRSVTYVTMSPQVEVTFEGYANKKHCVCECGHQLNYCISVIEELKGFDGGLDKHIHSLKHRDKLNPHTAPVSAAPANTQAITSFFKPRSKSNTPSNTNTTAPQATSANKNSNRRKKTSNTLPSVENVGASKKQNTIKHKLVFIESGPHPSIVEIQDGDPARIEYCAGFIPQFIQKMLDKGVCAANDIQEASVIRQEIGLSAMKFRLESEDHLDAGEILNESTSCMINTKKYSWIHIQQYLNYELNMAQYKGDKSQRVSHDRNRGVKRVKATGNVGDFNNNLEDTLSGALVVGDFVLLQGTRHKFMMCKTMKIYSIAEDGSVEQLMNCGFKDMNSDALYTDLLCLPYQHSRSRSMFTIIADDTHAEAHNDRLRCKIPIKQIIRLYYSLKDHVFQVGEKEIVNCIASLSQSNESDKEKEKALKAIKVDESLYVKLKKTAHHVSQKKQNQTQVKDKTTKAKATVPAKKKSIKETYNLPFECVNKHKKASGIFCVFCGTTVALSDMIRHQSLHFVKEDDNDDDTTDETTTTTPTFTFAVPQPTLQYYIDDGCLKVRSLAEPIELRGDECGICYSKCCRRIVVRTSKASRSKAETLKAFSECPLNFNYNYRSASVSSISNPVVNVPVNCPQENCDFMPYKYLLNEHMKRCHQTTANMSLTTEQLQQHNDRLKADMKREFKGEVLCDKPPSSNKNTNDKGKRATKERAAAKYSCE